MGDSRCEKSRRLASGVRQRKFDIRASNERRANTDEDEVESWGICMDQPGDESARMAGGPMSLVLHQHTIYMRQHITLTTVAGDTYPPLAQNTWIGGKRVHVVVIEASLVGDPDELFIF